MIIIMVIRVYVSNYYYFVLGGVEEGFGGGEAERFSIVKQYGAMSLIEHSLITTVYKINKEN